MGAINRHYEGFREQKRVEEGGLIRISGTFLLDHSEEILNLIKHEGRIWEADNATAKLTKIEKADDGYTVETNNHKLALHIGKCLHKAYKGEHEYKFLKDEKFVEVDWKRDN
ncbi:MAG: hypothetical protein WC890_00325 [Candidatus Margulisiibacteriota bacterium]